MRIVIAGPIGGQGGLQTHFSELVAFMESDGHEVHRIAVRTSSEPASFKIRSSAQQVQVNVVVRHGKGKLAKLADWIRAVFFIRKLKPEILISISNGTGFALLGIAAPRACLSVRTEVTDGWKRGAPLHEAMARIYDATAVQSPALLVAQRRKLRANHKIAVLPCLATLDITSACACEPTINEPLRIAYFGRLAANKGLIELVHAVRASSTSAKFSLEIWGRGVMQDELQRQINSNGLENIIYLKGAFPSGEKFATLLSNYHGLVLPSQYSEGLPLILLEAASVGLPFLSCDVGAIKDCAIRNPDVKILATGQNSLNSGLVEWMGSLRAGEYNPQRLKAWYAANHSRELQMNMWRKMLAQKLDYFDA